LKHDDQDMLQGVWSILCVIDEQLRDGPPVPFYIIPYKEGDDLKKKRRYIRKLQIRGALQEKWVRTMVDGQKFLHVWPGDNYREIQSEYKERISSPQLSLAIVEYSSRSGSGIANGKHFKFKGHRAEFRVFKKMYTKIGESIPREEILKLSDFEADSQSSTYFINELTKSMRRKTGLNTSQIVQSNGSITLMARKHPRIP
jgi:hypothetical protein